MSATLTRNPRNQSPKECGKPAAKLSGYQRTRFDILPEITANREPQRTLFTESSTRSASPGSHWLPSPAIARSHPTTSPPAPQRGPRPSWVHDSGGLEAEGGALNLVQHCARRVHHDVLNGRLSQASPQARSKSSCQRFSSVIASATDRRRVPSESSHARCTLALLHSLSAGTPFLLVRIYEHSPTVGDAEEEVGVICGYRRASDVASPFLLEEGARETGLSDDRPEGADSQLAVIGNWDRPR